jgi:hypothetical protein
MQPPVEAGALGSGRDQPEQERGQRSDRHLHLEASGAMRAATLAGSPTWLARWTGSSSRLITG